MLCPSALQTPSPAGQTKAAIQSSDSHWLFLEHHIPFCDRLYYWTQKCTIFVLTVRAFVSNDYIFGASGVHGRLWLCSVKGASGLRPPRLFVVHGVILAPVILLDQCLFIVDMTRAYDVSDRGITAIACHMTIITGMRGMLLVWLPVLVCRWFMFTFGSRIGM